MKKPAIFLLCLLFLAVPAEGKTLPVRKENVNVNQLHDELLAAFPEWRGTPQPDGSFKDPLLKVESSSEEIFLTIPEEAGEASVQQVVAAHLPAPARPAESVEPAERKSAKKKLKAIGFTDAEISEIFRRP